MSTRNWSSCNVAALHSSSFSTTIFLWGHAHTVSHYTKLIGQSQKLQRAPYLLNGSPQSAIRVLSKVSFDQSCKSSDKDALRACKHFLNGLAPGFQSSRNEFLRNSKWKLACESISMTYGRVETLAAYREAPACVLCVQ